MVEFPVAALVQRDQIGGIIDLAHGGGVREAGYIADVADIDVETVATSCALSQPPVSRTRESSDLRVKGEGAVLGPEFSDGPARKLKAPASAAGISAVGLRAAAGRADRATSEALGRPMLCRAPPRAEQAALFLAVGSTRKRTSALSARGADDFAALLGKANAGP